MSSAFFDEITIVQAFIMFGSFGSLFILFTYHQYPNTRLSPKLNRRN